MTRARRAMGAAASDRRADVQGLRAVAVLSVLAFHVLGTPSGGFLGVDVFFVVSGYVITSTLLRRAGRDGGVDLAGFYLRRARRILPLGLLVLGVTVVASHLTWAAAKAWSVTTDALFAALFVANWRFAASESDYFALGTDPSPLQHYWSLGVEEQFYLVWPGLLLVGLALLRRRGRDALARVVVALAAAVGVASLAWGAHQVATEPTVAYYSSLTRAWEIALGCLVATLPTLRLPDAARSVGSWLGLAGIVAAMVATGSGDGVPVPASLGACAATAVALASGHGGAPRGAFLLVNPVARYLGDISYGLYLWHFPVAVLGAAWLGADHPAYAAAALGMSGALAAATHHGVERPCLGGVRRREVVVGLTALAVLLAGSGVAVALLLPGDDTAPSVPAPPSATPDPALADPAGTAATSPGPTPGEPTATASPTPAPTTAQVVPLGPTGEAIQAGLRGGLALGSWPGDLDPPDPTTGGNPSPGIKDCAATRVDDPRSCTLGNPDGPEIVVYGDSLGINLLATVEAAYGKTHRIRGLTKLACAVNGVRADFGKPDWAIPCDRHREAVIAYVNRVRPQALFMVENYHWSNRLLSKATGDERAAEWIAADESFAAAIAPSGTRVVVVSPSVPGVGYFDCYRSGGSPQRCTTGVAAWWRATQEAEKRVGGVAFVDTLHWYCVDGRCPIVSTLGGRRTLMKVDYLHVTYQYNQLLGSDLRYRLEAVGVRL